MNIVNKVLPGIVAIALTATTAFAQLDVSAKVVSKHVWRGMMSFPASSVQTGSIPTFQPDLVYSFGETGLSVEAWSNFGLNREDSAARTLDEVDLTLDYARTIEKASMNVGVTRYDNFKYDNWPDEFSTNYEVYGGICLDKCFLKPFAKLWYAVNPDFWDGYYLKLGIGHNLVFENAQSLNLSLSAGFSNQSFFEEAGLTDIEMQVKTTLCQKSYAVSPFMKFVYVPDPFAGHDPVMIMGGIGLGFSI